MDSLPTEISGKPNANSGFPGSSDGEESACNAGDLGSVSWSGRSPGGGEFHGERKLAGYSSQGHKKLDMTERLSIAQYRGKRAIQDGELMVESSDKM